MGLKSTGGGEIVQVQGGHIIRATGRKDRHSKVFTAKGPRDRRVRLSAHTAIQFYDVQDRLGYDRPSKAVDWLIKKAKASIDKLAELPPWDPNAASVSATSTSVDGNGGSNINNTTNNTNNIPQQQQQQHVGESSSYQQQLHSLIPQGVDSMKPFFPTTNSEDNDNPMSFQNYPHDLISRGSNQSQDLCLSLHTLQDPGVSTHPHHHQSHTSHGQAHALFQGSGSLGFDDGSAGGGWADQHQHQDIARFTRLMGWAAGGSSGGGSSGEGRSGILFNPPPLPPQALLLGQQQQQQGTTNVAYSQRGTLQSSYSPLIRAFEDNHHHNHQQQQPHHHHPSISGLGLGSDGFMGFGFPSQIHGDMHEGTSLSNRASSSSLSPDSSQH